MKLLNVEIMLDRDKGIQQVGHETEVLKELDDKMSSYAILSHRWGTEVGYKEMIRLVKMGEKEKEEVRQRDGYQKIIKSCEQAKKDGYSWLWIDTCCIDKRSSAELSEAINSMYRWYRNAQKCYAYLNDVDESALPTEQDFSRFGKSNGWPEWFSRGWTLQELIAPRELEFFNKRWVSIGTKQELTSTLKDITRIPEKVLRDGEVLRSTRNTRSGERPLVAHIMSWAADRKTTRVEDRAYSLLGLFGVNMPMLYGEGSKAFQRLQLEIIRASSDHSIFAWNPKGRLGEYGSVLADDPSCFRGCHDIETVYPGHFVGELREYMRQHGLDMDTDKFESLQRGGGSPQLSIFIVTNVGIQVWLPVLPHRYDSEYFQAILPCRDRYGNLTTIDMESLGLSSGRCPAAAWTRYTWPEFRSLYLDCSQDDEESYHHLRLDDKRALWQGFTRCGTFPCEIASDTVTLSSQGNTLIVLVYANDDARSRFAVGFGCYLGRVWTRVVCDECSANQEDWPPWTDFAKQAYDVLWNAPIDESDSRTVNNIKNTHLPQSVWDARIVWATSPPDHTDVMIDIAQCPGCCTGPRQLAYTSLADDLWLPWTSHGDISRKLKLGGESVWHRHELKLDGQSAWLGECSDHGITPGDYGNSYARNFKRRGNIFEDMRELGIDPTDPVYCPVNCHVSSYERVPRPVQIQDNVVTATRLHEKMLLLEPKGFSLPNNEELGMLLKALSNRLAGNRLVTTVIQCSAFYKVDDDGSPMDAGGDAASSTGGNRSADPGTGFTPLCIVVRPLAWYREPACERRREQFKNIREHFYALANLDHLAGTESGHKSVDKWQMHKMYRRIDYSAMFGLSHLQNYVGEVTFFKRLPSVLETQPCSEASVGRAGENGLSAFVGAMVTRGQPFQSRNHEGVAILLLKKCRALGGWSLDEKQKARREVMSISQTLGVGLLEHICNFLLDAAQGKQQRGQVGRTDYNTADVHSTIQEIKALQAKLQAAEDKDEQRALEEDITGKILWFYWCGICSEVNQLLAKVVDYIKDKVETLGTYYRLGVREIAETIKGTLSINLEDDITHLHRIMLDARAGISRHGLWLSAREAEQAGLAKVFGGNPTLSTREVSTSIVEQMLDTGKERL